LALPEFGEAAQRALKRGRVLLVGAGGLGSPAALYLVAAGVGTIGIVDDDLVDEANLQRQILHGTGSVGRPKLESAAARLRDLNPHVQLELFPVRLTADNALRIIEPFDIVVDGSDNFPARYLVNDACVLLGKPNVYGSIFRFEGQASVFYAKEGPCYRCMFPEPPPPGMVPNCAEGGVFGVICATIGAGQATEGIKLITGVGEPLIGRMQIYDALENRWQLIKVNKDPECPVCGKNPTVTALIDYEEFCGVPANDHESEGADVSAALEISCSEFAAIAGNVKLIDVREPHEWQISRIPGAELMPLSEFAGAVQDLDPDVEYVVHCKSGVRSLQALEMMRDAGITKVRSLAGGINAYARNVDNSIPTY